MLFSSKLPCLLISGISLKILLTVSSAIFLKVVHFPPVTVISPLVDVSTTWLRESAFVPSLIFIGSRTNGLIPLQLAMTSSFFKGKFRNLLLSCIMNSTSSLLGFGSIVSSVSLSVVPARVAPSHGRKKSTLPSLVLGTIKPIFEGEKWSGSTMCTPAAGVIISSTDGSSIFLIESAKHPVAFTTALAFITHSEPVSSSLTNAPDILPVFSSFNKPIAFTLFATDAPD
mmetsp:Transcript_9559/g.14395  ORF Transcript_9559/g.14395 Transcript_9559/m.14395 type:complete len:228 (+) Transcript_9559:457-1140(+)